MHAVNLIKKTSIYSTWPVREGMVLLGNSEQNTYTTVYVHYCLLAADITSLFVPFLISSEKIT